MRPREVKRTAIIVKPKQRYIQWANSLDEDGVKLGGDIEAEHTVYLIDEVTGYEVDMQAMVAPYYEFIFEEELNA